MTIDYFTVLKSISRTFLTPEQRPVTNKHIISVVKYLKFRDFEFVANRCTFAVKSLCPKNDTASYILEVTPYYLLTNKLLTTFELLESILSWHRTRADILTLPLTTIKGELKDDL